MRTVILSLIATSVIVPSAVLADGKMMPIRVPDYKGSVEERGQEAILILTRDSKDNVIEDLIFKAVPKEYY